jgi:hypothetical protein
LKRNIRKESLANHRSKRVDHLQEVEEASVKVEEKKEHEAAEAVKLVEVEKVEDDFCIYYKNIIANNK